MVAVEAGSVEVADDCGVRLTVSSSALEKGLVTGVVEAVVG